MASTYSNTGIELIGVGEQANTWGQTTNTNWRLVDELASGVVEISLNGLTSYTLTTVDGLTSNGRHMVIRFTGTPGGPVTVTISPNALQKLYFIQNTTSEDVTITQGSGGDTTVSAGRTKIVHCDGNNSSAAVADLFAAVEVGATGNFSGDFDGAFSGSFSGTAELTSLSINETEVTITAAQINASITAAGTSYVNSSSGLEATNAQDALDELSSANAISVDNAGTAFTTDNVQDTLVELLTIPQETYSDSYTLQASDTGSQVSISSGDVTVPAGVFSAGDIVVIYNNSSTQRSVIADTGVTMYWVDGATGDRDLLKRALASIVCVGADTFVISGQGVI